MTSWVGAASNGAILPQTPGIRSALKAVLDAIRAPMAVEPEHQPDRGYDPTFMERAAPLLEFLWSQVLPGAPDRHGEHARRRARPGGGQPLGRPALRRRHVDPRLLPAAPAAPAAAPAGGELRLSFALDGAAWSRASAACARRWRTRSSCSLAGNLVGVFPEGLRGVGKLYRERYRLSHFGRGGFVRLARQAKVPIIPVAIVGAEEIHPLLGRMTRWPTAGPALHPDHTDLSPAGPAGTPTGAHQVEHPDRRAHPGARRRGIRAGHLEIAETVRRRVDQMIADLLIQRRSIIFG